MNAEVLKRRVAPLVCEFLTRSRLYNLATPFFGGIGCVLNLHRVLPRATHRRVKSVAALEVTPEWIEQSIAFYRARNIDVVSLDTMVAILDGTAPRRRFVVYTFDDGYEDNLRYAYPVFKRQDAPFAVYVAAGFPDGEVIPWWYLLEDLVLASSRLEVNLETKQLSFDCTTEAGQENAFYRLRTEILDGARGNLKATLRQIFEPHGIDLNKYRGLALRWDQVRELAHDPLVTIGAHSITHRPLSKLSLEDMTREVVSSKERLERETGTQVHHFAFPYGARDEAGEREFNAVQAAGYKSGVTTRTANLFAEHKNFLWSLPRNLISGEREGLHVGYLDLWLSGTIPALENRFKRVVTT